MKLIDAWREPLNRTWLMGIVWRTRPLPFWPYRLTIWFGPWRVNVLRFSKEAKPSE